MKKLAGLTALLALPGAPSRSAAPRPPSRPLHDHSQRAPYGIGKTYHGPRDRESDELPRRAVARAPERMQEERPDLVLAALDLKPGMKVADVGAGSGYYSSRMAERVGKSGTVYAVDVQPEMIEILKQNMSERGAGNVKAVLGTETDPKPARRIARPRPDGRRLPRARISRTRCSPP